MPLGKQKFVLKVFFLFFSKRGNRRLNVKVKSSRYHFVLTNLRKQVAHYALVVQDAATIGSIFK
jgi:hypothetical protein